MRTTFRSPLRLLVTALAVLAAASATRAAPQGKTEVSAQLSAGVLRLGDTGHVTLSAENASTLRLAELPQVEGLQFGKPGQPSMRQFTSNDNGRITRSSSVKVAVPFRPLAEGEYTIPPLVLDVDGQRLETRPLHVTVVVDITGADFGFLEVRPSATKVVEGQPFTLELTFGWEENERVEFAELNLPWWDSLPGAVALETPPIPQQGKVDGIRINGAVEVAAQQVDATQRDGKRFVTLRLLRSYLPSRSGTLEFPTSFFEFGRRRQVSIFDTRRESHFVQAGPFTVEVVELPGAGQPLDFSGAVGELTARASADARDVRAGDSIKLTVVWTGQGNLGYFRAPDPAVLEAFRGFRVYGTTEEKARDLRRVVYDLAPLSSDVRAIPSVPLSVFDPVSGSYETVATEPIPIRVRGLERGLALEDDETRFERDIEDIEAAPPAPAAHGEERDPDRFLLAAVIGVPLIGLIARAGARRRGRDPGAPLERRRRNALRQLERALRASRGPGDDHTALLDFLASRTRESRESWEGRDLARWAAAAAPELPAELRMRAASLQDELDAALWGGGRAPEHARVLAVARELTEAGL
jgi:hypothetical protein